MASNDVEVRIKTVVDPKGLAGIKSDAKAAGTEAGDAFTTGFESGTGNLKVDTGKLSGLKSDARQAGEEGGDALADGFESSADAGMSGAAGGIVENIGGLLKAGLASVGLAAGAAVMKGVTDAMGQDAVVDRLGAQLGNAEFGKDMGKIAGNLYVGGFGESLGDSADLVRKVWQNGLIPEDAADADIERVAGKIGTFTDVMGQDIDMTTQAIQSMIKSGIADSADEALDVMTRGIQQGADKAGDLAETFQEYGTSFRESGLTAADAAGLMSQGLRAGARDADKVADAFKEFGIRAQDGSKLSAEGFKAIGMNAEEMTQIFAEGGPRAREALGDVLDGLREIEDPAARNAAAVALFGTQAEDLGDALFALDLDTAAQGLGDLEGATEDLNSAYDNATSKIESFKRKGLMALTEFIGGPVLTGLENLWSFLSTKLGPVFSDVANAISDFVGGLDWSWVSDAAAKVEEFWNALRTGLTADEGTGVERVALAFRDFLTFLRDEVLPAVQAIAQAFIDYWSELAPKLLPIIQQIASIFVDLVELVASIIERLAPIIGAILVAIAWVWTNWGDEIMAIVQRVWDAVIGIIQGALDIIQGIIRLVTALIQGDWSEAWDAFKQIVDGAWQIITSIISLAWDGIMALLQLGLDGLQALWENKWTILGELANLGWELIKQIFQAAWDAIKLLVELGWETIKQLFIAAWDAIVLLVTENWEAIKTIFTTAWDALTALVSAAWEAIKTIFTTAFEFIKALVTGDWETVRQMTSDAWEAIKSLLSDAWEAIKSTISAAIEVVKSTLSEAWESIRSTAESTWETIRSTISDAISAIQGTVEDAWNSMTSTVANAASSIKGSLSGLWDNITAGLASKVSDAKAMINDLIAAYNSIPVLPDVGFLATGASGGRTFSQPAASGRTTASAGRFGFASGGIVGAARGGIHGGWRMVGEHGRELIKLGAGSQVRSNPDTERDLARMGGGRGMTLIVNVHGSVLSDRDLAEKLRDMLYAGDYASLT